jgi:nucleotide-binding universal stress UspA family protein
VPGVRRIIAGVSGSPRALPALRFAADLARDCDAAFVPIYVWRPSGPELAAYHFPSDYLLPEWQDAAWERLWHALEMAFGGVPPGTLAEPLIACGNTGPVLVGTACGDGDTLVIGTGRRAPSGRPGVGRVSRYCLGHAVCPVIAIPPPVPGPGVRDRAWRHKSPAADDIISWHIPPMAV